VNVIVVGVDGSDHSLAALRYALSLARDGDAVVRVVTAWHVPSLTYAAGVVTGDLAAELEEAATQAQEDALTAAASATDGLTVQRSVQEGDAGHVLVAESESADMLVVGSHGHGEIGELVLGSASHYCCRHARCPVVVIPHGALVVS